MYTAYHRQNSNFHLRYFLAGSCFTADAAYFRVLMELEQIEPKLMIIAIREKEEEILDEKLRHASSAIERLQAEKELLEHRAQCFNDSKNLEGALRERGELTKLLDEIRPSCKFVGALPTLQEAWDACQREEWLEELKHRAENFLIFGPIPASEMAVFRQHPDFEQKIVPHIQSLFQGFSKGDPYRSLEMLVNKNPSAYLTSQAGE